MAPKNKQRPTSPKKPQTCVPTPVKTVKSPKKISQEHAKEVEQSLQTQEPKKIKLALGYTPMSPLQVLNIYQKTPRKYTYKRPGKGGGEWDYVTGGYVKKRLNHIFGFLWSYYVDDHGIEGGQVWVKGRLEVKLFTKWGQEVNLTKTQFGRADIKFKKNSKDMLDFGNDLKAAATDGLKKCASEFGIANDIYNKNEYQENQLTEDQVEIPALDDDNDPATTAQLQVLKVKNIKVPDNITKGQARLEIMKASDGK